jgi:hypothetical protein
MLPSQESRELDLGNRENTDKKKGIRNSNSFWDFSLFAYLP